MRFFLPSLVLLTVSLSLSPLSCQAQDGLPSLDVVRDFGARGDGRTDDTLAFARLTGEVNRRGGGVSVVIPPGTYVVGGQVPGGKTPDGTPYRYAGRDVMLFQKCERPIRVQGAGATLRLPDGMRFGSFDAGGKRFDPPLPFWDTRGSGMTGFLVGAVFCADVRVSGLELDGRNTSYILGGAWGDRERQCRSYGFYFDQCRHVELESASAHNFGLDGLYIKAPGLRAGDAPRPHILNNCRFEWNGRQGLSWSGGIGLRATNCSFAHTGYALNARSNEPVFSGPGAGVDIESEQSVCRDGVFQNCDFFHTRGPGLYCEVGDNADVSFGNCRFWNFDNYAILPKAPRLIFSNCRIYGAAISAYSSAQSPADGTRFVRCTFEDKAHPTLGQPFADAYASLLAFDGLSGGLRLEECAFIAHRVKGPYIRQPNAGAPSGWTIDGGSMRLEHFNGPGESVATLQGGTVRNFTIASAFNRAAAPGLHIWTDGRTSVGQDVELVGAGVGWGGPGGKTGALSPQ